MRLLSIAGILCLTAAAQGAVVVWDGGGMNGNFDNPANWEGDMLPVSGTDPLLFISASGAGQKTVDMNVDYTAKLTSGSGAVVFGPNTAGGNDVTIAGMNTLTIDGNGSSAAIFVQAGAGSGNKITAPVVFNNTGTIKNTNLYIEENFSISSVSFTEAGNGRSFWNTSAGKTLTLSKIAGVIGAAGAGDLNFVGDGTVILDGSESNTVSAVMNITDNGGGMNQQPIVVFAKTGTAQAYTGTRLSLSTGTLRLAGGNNDQIIDTVSFIIGSIPATLDMNGHSETMGTMRSFGGTIDFSDPASENLWFQLGAGVSWSGTLNITGFTVGSDTLRFGTTAAGIGVNQLNTIKFDGLPAQVDAMGFVTPIPIPEPSTLGLLGLVGLGFLWRRRAARS